MISLTLVDACDAFKEKKDCNKLTTTTSTSTTATTTPAKATTYKQAFSSTSNQPSSSKFWANRFTDAPKLHEYLTHTFPKVAIPHRLTAYPMTKYSDTHYWGVLLQWACTNGTFLHPSLQVHHERGAYRDYNFTTTTSIAKGTPLLAIPEELVIGFKEGVDEFDRNALFDTQRENAFNKVNKGLVSSTSPVNDDVDNDDDDEDGGNALSKKDTPSDSDVCDFFFFCLGTLVSDLVTAVSSELTDIRFPFAKSLSRIRTLTNAPYLADNTVFSTSNPLHVNIEAIEAAAEAQEAKEEEGLQVPEEEWERLPPKAKKMIDMRRRALDTKRLKRKEVLADQRRKQEVVGAAKMGVVEDDAEADAAKEEHHASLADVVLQMIRNYIQGGPLTNKVDPAELRWAVSVCLSHSTPLVIGDTRSIGIVPIVHLFPHGGLATNAVVVARPSPSMERACGVPAGAGARRMAEYAQRMSGGFEFPSLIRDEHLFKAPSAKKKVPGRRAEPAEGGTGGFVYVVAMRDIQQGESIHIQAMAPVCEKDEESEHMWRLSCGAAPLNYYRTSEVAQLSEDIQRMMMI